MVKIAISGKMCSGKSTLTNRIIEHFGKIEDIHFSKYSFADGVYKIARELFGMTVKNRELLTQIGYNLRLIDKDIWVKDTLKNINNNKHNFVIIDDLRFKNELKYLKDNYFFIIRLNISEEQQINRLKKKYPNTFQEHINNLNNISETDLDDVQDNLYDIIFHVTNLDEEYLSEKIIDLIYNKIMKKFNEF